MGRRDQLKPHQPEVTEDLPPQLCTHRLLKEEVDCCAVQLLLCILQKRNKAVDVIDGITGRNLTVLQWNITHVTLSLTISAHYTGNSWHRDVRIYTVNTPCALCAHTYKSVVGPIIKREVRFTLVPPRTYRYEQRVHYEY